MAYEETSNPLRGVEAHPGSGHYAVYDNGAHVWAWQPDGAAPVLWMSEKSVLEEGSAVRGGIPVCFPWFGKGPSGDLESAHGFGRIRTWHRSDIKDTLDRDGRLLVEYSLDSAMTSEVAEFAHDYVAYVLVKFTPEYVAVNLNVTNNGSEPFTFEGALHTYLAVSDVRNVTVSGLDGAGYLDKVTGERATQDGDVTITGETDRVYDSTGEVVLDDPGLGRKLTISKEGSANTVVWNPWVDKSAAMPDFADDEWVGMICIEAANTGEGAVTLRPGETHHMRQKIALS